MSAVGSPEQSAKRVVSKCGLIGLSAAVSNSPIAAKERKRRIQWLGELLKSSDTIRIPSSWHLGYELYPRDDFGDALEYALHTRKEKTND